MNAGHPTESGGRAQSGKKVSFARWYICQCKRKKLTKKQEAAKAEAQKKKQFQKQPHPMNTETNQLDLLSKNRDKKTDCGSKCEVELWWNHNHSVNSFHLQSFCPILPSTKAAFEGYFENEDYNNKNATKGGKCFLQTFEQSENSEQPLIVAICTPLMSRVHQLRQAGEMAFLDASGSLDRFNNPVYFMCTHHPVGALPLGVWITSGQSQYVTNQCLENLQNVLPPHALGGRGPKTGPQIFMTDDDSGQRGALSDTLKDSLLLLCTFHFLQAVWRWLFNSNNNISKEDRQHLMGHFQKLVFAASQKEFKSAAKAALTDKLTLKYSNYQEYLKKEAGGMGSLS
ncbi:hypothetical protein ACROYT_G014901 [Oculina patagonica]